MLEPPVDKIKHSNQGVSWYGCLGAQIGLGWGQQNKHDIVMVEDPPVDFSDLEEVMQAFGPHEDRRAVDPKTLRELSGRFLQFVAP